MYCQRYKRIFDFIIALSLIVLLFPFGVLLMMMIRLFLGGPVFYKQLRPGWHEKPFWLYKFRTMVDLRDENGQLLDDENRLTRFGKLLRSLSVDELPELFNVLKGEMSLVGPRPLLMEYLPYYTEEQKIRHLVRPGITGWAQINGRNTLTWQKKFEFDSWYVKNCSFALDLKIILITILKIVKREGIHALGHATMSRFDHEAKRQVFK